MKKIQKIMAIIIIGVILMQSFALTGANVYAAGNETSNTIDNETNNITNETTNAKIEVRKEGTCRVNLSISNINLTDTDYNYYIKITNTKTKPKATSLDDITPQNEWNSLAYDMQSNKFKDFDVTKYMELNDDMYVWVIGYEYKKGIKEIISGEKIDHISTPKDSRLFSASFITSLGTQLSFCAPKDTNTERKFTYTIGEIKDNDILNDIKNENSQGFDKLLNYAKQGNYILTGNLSTKGTNNLYYSASTLDLTGKLVEGKYYYVYVKFDDEGGKYYPVEGVTLGLAKIPINWYLFLYGEKDFNWSNVGSVSSSTDSETTPTNDGKKEEGKKDDTTAKDPIPQTGQTAIISAVAVVTLLGLGAIIRYKNIQIK